MFLFPPLYAIFSNYLYLHFLTYYLNHLFFDSSCWHWYCKHNFYFAIYLFFFSDTNDPFSFCCFFAEPGLTMHFSVEEEIEARGKKYKQTKTKGFPNFLGGYVDICPAGKF
jgi:hypothetical protein